MVSTITFGCIDLLQSVFSFPMLRVLMWETMVDFRLLDLIAQLNRSVRTTTEWRAEPPTQQDSALLVNWTADQNLFGRNV
jgi:hypothetical protein